MALFIDGEINTIQDLARYESGLLEISHGEQVDLSQKLALAQEALGSTLLAFLLKQSSSDPAGYLSGFQTSLIRRAIGVADVVITEPLKRTHAWKTLALVYQDAYYNQLNDRYKQKWHQYDGLVQSASAELFTLGVGISSQPLMRPSRPLLLSSSGNATGAAYYVRTTWVNQAGQESAPSEVSGLATVDGTLLVVTVSNPPAAATGWNVYVGATPDDVSIQNETPLAIGTNWSLPSLGLRLAHPPNAGQIPDRYVIERRTVLRG